MEKKLSENLLLLCDVYKNGKSLKETTVGRLCAADGRFFARIREGKTFTAKKYDEVITWFSHHWPHGLDWPGSVERPV